MRVWIDFSNSPHPLLFAPVARRLEELGHEILLTARNNAQTVALARERWPSVEVIGGPSPGNRIIKARAAGSRVVALTRWAQESRPDVALSHNSYAQIAAAWLLRIPIVTAMDYEHQPANHLAFRLASRTLVPEVFPAEALRHFGARCKTVTRYAGLKELLYLGDFVPNDDVLTGLGLSRNGSQALVVSRTPPVGALYHPGGNSLFQAVLRALGRRADVRCIVLPRSPEQRARLLHDGPGCLVPAGAVDARSLMHAADLVIGAGGTMTREAALLGVPTLSVFAGRPAAADIWLQGQGLLRRLERLEDVAAVPRRTEAPRSVDDLRTQGAGLVETFVHAVTHCEPTGRSSSGAA